MEKEVKNQILQLLATLQEAHDDIGLWIENEEYEKVRGILADCQESAISAGNRIEQFEKNQGEIIRVLEEYCEQLFCINTALVNQEQLNGAAVREKLNQYIIDARRRVKNNIKTLKAVFFPYKASMWASLDSIWRAAQKDVECEAKVVVIPYHTLDSNGKEDEFHYEASLFPPEVPIVHYNQYAIEQERPDVVFIHNPYDGGNSVTRVPKEYYSYRLKMYTKRLVYSPYCLLGYYSPEEGSFLCLTNGAQLADKVLVQSERVKQIYMDHKIDEKRLLALGSPKVDAIVEGMKMPKAYPKGWEQKLGGRKVFLLNTHLSYFVMGFDAKQQRPDNVDFAQWHHEDIFNHLLNREGCGLIWRPHPLLKAMLKSRNLYSSLEFIEKWEQRIAESGNGVLDENGEYATSFHLSDALITTYSTMIAEYMISGKPVCIFEYPLDEENCKNSPLDYRHNYYKERRGEESKLFEFIQMVLDERDPLYEERMKDVHRAFDNLEGTVGENVYEWLKRDSLELG